MIVIERLKSITNGGLHLTDCVVGDDEFVRIIRLIPTFSLEWLKLTDVKLDPDAGFELAKAVYHSRTIYRLNIGANNFSDDQVHAFIVSTMNGVVKLFTIKDYKMNDLNIELLRQTLMNRECNLCSLSLPNCNLGKGLGSIFTALPYTKLQTIELDNIGMSDKDVIGLSSILNQTKIKYLYLTNNNITDIGVKSLSNVIRNSNILVGIGLTHNKGVTNQSVEYLKTAIKCHPSMRYIDLDNTGVSLSDEQRLRRILVVLYSSKSKLMTVLCSIKTITRIGKKCKLRVLPIELFRKIADTLYVEKKYTLSS